MKKIAELRSRFDALIAEIGTLRGAESPTEDQATRLKDALAEAETLKGEIADLEADEARAVALQQFAAIPTPQADLRGNPVRVTTPAVAGNDPTPADKQRSTFERNLAHDMYNRGWNDKKIERLFDEDYKEDFFRYLRGERALNEGTVSDGGAVIPAPMLQEIVQRRAAFKRVANAVNRVTISSDAISFPVYLGGSSTKISDVSVSWLGESGNASEDTGLENWGNIEIRAHRGGFIVAASRSWLEDASTDMEGWMVDCIADTYNATVEDMIINGSGVGRPWGMITRVTTGNPNTISTTNIGNPIAASSLVGLLGTIDEQYAANASFIMERATFFSQIASLKDSVGAFYFGTNSTTDGGTTARVESTLLGYPNLMSDHMPSLGAAEKVLIYGDVRAAYTLVERVGLSVEPYYDPAYQKADRKAWYVRFRLGGDVLRPYAVRVGVNS